jgi:hypothetical protein
MNPIDKKKISEQLRGQVWSPEQREDILAIAAVIRDILLSDMSEMITTHALACENDTTQPQIKEKCDDEGYCTALSDYLEGFREAHGFSGESHLIYCPMCGEKL